MTFEPILQAAQEGLALVFSWPNVCYPIVGTLLSMLVAVMPGLGGSALMALAIPFTFDWEPLPVLLLFGSFVGGATFMGSVTAILFNIPGTGANAATMFDGYPMARRGEARTALACSATASALGSSFGIFALVLALPVLREFILAFGPPELLMLAVWGLAMLAALTGGSVVKGLAMGALGLLLALIGLNPQTAELRYTFGTLYLRDGLNFIPTFLGIFAMAQAADLALGRRPPLPHAPWREDKAGSAAEGVRAVFRNPGLLLRSSLIGTVVGFIPGIGGAVASFIAYGQAARSGGGKGLPFGEGNIRGVLAPEAANDAKDGGSLIPTLAFGIPGNAATAVLLAVFAVHGITPGRAMLNDNLALVFALIWSLFLSNLLTSITGLAMVNPLSRLGEIRARLLAPIVFVLAAAGAYLQNHSAADVTVALVFGALGFLMTRNGWPRVPLVMGLVLGSLFETNLLLTMRLQQLGRVELWNRPLALALLALAALSLMAAARGWSGARRASRAQREDGSPSRAGEGLAFTGLLLVIAGIFAFQTIGLGPVARLVPAIVGAMLAALVAAQFLLDWRSLRRAEAGK